MCKHAWLEDDGARRPSWQLTGPPQPSAIQWGHHQKSAHLSGRHSLKVPLPPAIAVADGAMGAKPAAAAQSHRAALPLNQTFNHQPRAQLRSLAQPSTPNNPFSPPATSKVPCHRLSAVTKDRAPPSSGSPSPAASSQSPAKGYEYPPHRRLPVPPPRRSSRITMPASLDSSRPIMAASNRTSVRFSTYSMVAPSLTPTFQTTDSAQAEIRDIALGLDRMENKALSSQRVVLSDEKTDNMSKLALGAKLERALDRRMSSQDAVMRPRQKSIKVSISEKTPISEKA
ncbi:hypothetical protein PCL_06105 [Purpureocillium lilacinum]|uniref:Uncharacterized protein n=2 Tax=Purpureocillium lilacinum TaxID=33203 RepID=A0A2U3ELQ2_PURLI|nr:hypothetical protein Purlil1_10355 [Purpureocillium lilacinum]PWI75447.1 hypothetical protein PCL_06105 [Purpureocillium lilacinum]